MQACLTVAGVSNLNIAANARSRIASIAGVKLDKQALEAERETCASIGYCEHED
jgi:hypothetical protein